MVRRSRPVRYQTDKYEILEDKIEKEDHLVLKNNYDNKWKSPENSYVLSVGLIGPVNSGKSELMGKLGHKVSAVSPKNNTTTEIIHNVKSLKYQTDEGIRNVQLKFHDTPGLMYKKEGFVSKGWKVLGEIDFSLLVVDGAQRFN